MKFFWDAEQGKWVERIRASKSAFPHIWRDLPAYKSPVGSGMIEGRAARREDLKRANCREVDPGEWTPSPKTAQQAAAERAQLEARRSNPFSLPQPARERLVRGR